MTHAIASARMLTRRLLPMLGMLLLLLLSASGAHHHADGMHHACAICTVGHSPAITADLAAPVAAPNAPGHAVHATPERAPRAHRLESAPSRAPPLA